MVRTALLCYHKNADVLYPPKWINQYRGTILNQTYKDFAIFEINYGGTNYRLFPNSFFESVEMPTFIHALNYLLDKCFFGGYECCANTNVDDFYDLRRLEKQIPFIEQGYDIVSSNFCLVKDDRTIICHYFDKLDIKAELNKKNNIVGHPAVCYSKNFWEHNRYIPDEGPFEDMKLWERSIDKFNFIILPDFLFSHRIHDNAVCRSNNK